VSIKAEQDSAKRRKTEWHAGLQKMPGDTTLCKEILDYLSMFTDPTEQVSGDQSASARVHPADLVLEAFKDEETTYLTTQKIHTFLQEAHAVHGKKFEMDLETVEANMVGMRRISVPLTSIVLQRPDDGLPCIGDWLTTAISFMFSGSRLGREPLDLNAHVMKSDGAFLFIKKGFTRLTAPLLFLLIASDIDPVAGKDLILPLLPAFSEMFNLPVNVSVTTDAEMVSFDSIQLSAQGSERQKKDIMKCALRFEKLILERRLTESCRDSNDQELLQSIVNRYNGYKATAALRRWQIGPDMMSAMLAVICGMTSESRDLVRMHLDHNKFDESGKCLSFHQVSGAAQALHFQKYNLWWSMNAKKVKKSEHLKAAEYKVTITSLNHDFKEAVAFNQRRCKVGATQKNTH
ncbi:unnamed protein product, partial [Durusdinium trenchii]